MNCPICSTEMVKAKATNFGAEYDYCRTCKKELAEMSQGAVPASCAFGCDPNGGLSSSRCSIHGCGPLPDCVSCGARENETHGINCNMAFQSDKLGPCSDQTHKFSGKNPTPITVCNCGGRNWNGSWNPINPPGLNTMGVQSGRVSSKHPNAANGPKAISCGWCGLSGCSAQVWTDCASNMNPPPHRPITRASLPGHEERWLKEGGWVINQGHWAAPAPGDNLGFAPGYQFKKREDALKLETWRRMGLNNYDAHLAVDRYSWEDRAAADRRCEPTSRNHIQQAARAEYQRKKELRFIELYRGFAPKKLSDIAMTFRVHDEVTAEYAAKDAETTASLLKLLCEEHDLYTIVGEKIFKPKK